MIELNWMDFEGGIVLDTPSCLLLQASCYDVFHMIPNQSIDCILIDPPYNKFESKFDWDKELNFTFLWREFNRILTSNGVVIITANQPFTSLVVFSNLQQYKCSLVWNKKNPKGFLLAKRQPLRQHEDILVFWQGEGFYNPIMRKGKMRKKSGYQKPDDESVYSNNGYMVENDDYYPTSIITVSGANQTGKVHPTEKPVMLGAFLLEIFCPFQGRVLDCFMGGGSFGVAAVRTGREFLGIELMEKYVSSARERILEAVELPLLTRERIRDEVYSERI